MEIKIDNKFILDSTPELIPQEINLGYNLTKRKNYLKNLNIGFRRCKWCSNIIYFRDSDYCCEDCTEEQKDYDYLQWYKINGEKAKEKARLRHLKYYNNLTPEKKKLRIERAKIAVQKHRAKVALLKQKQNNES